MVLLFTKIFAAAITGSSAIYSDAPESVTHVLAVAFAYAIQRSTMPMRNLFRLIAVLPLFAHVVPVDRLRQHLVGGTEEEVGAHGPFEYVERSDARGLMGVCEDHTSVW